jgi:hypothetical protein
MTRYLYGIFIILFIIITTYLIIISKCEYKYYYSKRMNKLQRELFNDNNITSDNSAWNIYIPNGYNNIEQELRTIVAPYKGYNKYIFGVNGCDWVVSKNGLWAILRNKYGRDKARYIMPESYILHSSDEVKLLKGIFNNDIYILKKNIQRKNGLKITSDYNEILNGYKNGYKVAQKYITNVFLVNNRKLNIRVYMLIIHGVYKHMYIHRDCKCIYTNKEYNDDIRDFESNITSYNMDYVIYNQNPYSIEELNDYINKKHNIDVDIFGKIMKLMELVAVACKDKIYKSSNIKYARTYQLFGADIILDDNLVPYILEINKGPDMKIRCERDKILKEKVYRDVYGKLGIVKNNKNNFSKLRI